jgi:hypothetical protein
VPSRRTLALGILPFARSKETSLRNPASLGFLRRSIGTGYPSDLRKHSKVDDAMSAHTPLDCLLGRCDSLRAEVFFRAELPSGVSPGEAALTGTLSGPECKHAITLPVTAKLAAVPGPTPGQGPAAATSVVARAILTEPSFWTPELPGLYRLEARLVAAGREVATWRRPVGLRRLGVRGRSLWLDGRRHVPRGLVAPAERIDLARFRAAALAAVVPEPSDEFLTRADAGGVAVLGLLVGDAGQPLDIEAAAAAVLRWAWHPAVFAAVVPHGVSAEQAGEMAAATRGRRGTLLVAWEVDGSDPPPAVPAGVDLLVVTLPAGGLPHDAWRTEPPSLPLMARRPAAASAAESEPPSRGECDTFQAALAGWGTAGGPAPDWAGYVVG